jgi:hypothetical protein
LPSKLIFSFAQKISRRISLQEPQMKRPKIY